MVAREDELDEEVLEVLRQQPEKNSDGTTWKLKLGSQYLTKREIIDNWADDEKLRGDVRKLILGLKLHLLGRR
jgi:hypothetical protein